MSDVRTRAACCCLLPGLLAPLLAIPAATDAAAQPPLLAPSPAPNAATPPPPAARTVTLTFTVDGGDKELEEALKEASALEPLTKDASPTPDRILRAALGESAAISAALFAAARYQGIVSVTIAGMDPTERGARAAVSEAFATGPVPATVTVTVGPVFKFGVISVTDEAGRPTVIEPADTGLVPGAVAKSGEVRLADGRVLQAMRSRGYPLAKIVRRTAIADHANDELDVAFVVDTGRPARFGRVEVRGAKDMDSEFITGRAPFQPGQDYRPQPLEDYARDLRELGAFDSVRVVTGDTVDADGTIPIVVEVAERKPRFFGAAAQWSTTEGALLSAWWGHRNLFGGAETIRIEGEVARLFLNAPDDLEYRAGFTFTKPGIWTNRDSLVISNYFVRETPDAYNRTGWDGAVSIVRKYGEKEQYTVGLAPTVSQIDDSFGAHDYAYVGLVGEAKYDTTDNKLDPTSGYRLLVGVEPAAGSIGDSSAMFAATAKASTYVPLDQAHRIVLAGQVQVGSIFGPQLKDVPANARFYAGGGGTIRGYGYQYVSPRDSSGDITGGLSLFVASLELRAKVTETIGVVPFVDIGTAFRGSIPSAEDPLKIGAGIGLRYFTGIGPLRFDFAVPLEKEKDDGQFAVYLSLGQSF